jgi:hypothetical protein
MDWRLIAAVAAAVCSFGFVAIGARIILSSPPPAVTIGAAPALVVVPAGPPPFTSLQQPPSLQPPEQQASAPAMSVFAPEPTAAPGRDLTPPLAANQSPRGRPEPAAGYKTAALRPPNEEYALPAERPARPIVEAKRPSVVPDLQTAPPAPHYRGVLTTAEISRIRHNLRLSPDQEPAWPRVEAALAEMGRQQMALIRQGKEPRISPDDWPSGRLYSVAGPLLQTLRPDQKETIRRLCRTLGFEQVASML